MIFFECESQLTSVWKTSGSVGSVRPVAGPITETSTLYLQKQRRLRLLRSLALASSIDRIQLLLCGVVDDTIYCSPVHLLEVKTEVLRFYPLCEW